MEIITEIESVLYPVNIRFGVGIGKITTEINRELSIGADGPGYMIANGESQVDAARHLGVKPSTVQKILAKGKYYAYKDALDTIDKAMEEMNKWLAGFFEVIGVEGEAVLTWSLALLVIHKPANIMIQKLLMLYKPQKVSMEIKKDNNTGRFIGTMERIRMDGEISENIS